MANELYYRVSIDASGTGYDLSEDLSSFTLEQRDASPDQLRIELADAYKVLSHALQEGMTIEVDLGSGDEHSLIFRGRIYRVDSNFPEDDVPTLSLVAYDGTMRMGLRPRNRAFADTSLSEVVTKVASEYFDSVIVDIAGDISFDGNGMRQDEETDLAFLRRLATAYGCVMYAKSDDDEETFHFVAQYNVMSADPAVTLYYGRSDVDQSLLSFQSSADVSDIQLARVLGGIDYDTGKVIGPTIAKNIDLLDDGDRFFDENLTQLRASEPVKAAQLELLVAAAPSVQSKLREELGASAREAVQTFTTEAEVAALAKNQYSTSLRGMRANGRVLGNKELFARTSVGIEDTGERFSGKWYLATVRHLVNQDGYLTEFECQR